jgi:PAS domain S-box-containing protein
MQRVPFGRASSVFLKRTFENGSARPSPTSAPPVLLVAAESRVAQRLADLLAASGAATVVAGAASLQQALERLARADIAAALLVLPLPDATEDEALTRLRAAAPRAAILALLDVLDEERERRLLRAGAADCLRTGELSAPLLARALRYALERQDARLAALEGAPLPAAQTVLERMREGFIALDRAWRLTYVNRRAEMLLQRRRESLIGRVLWDELPALATEPFFSTFHAAAESGQVAEFEAALPPDERWLEVRAYPAASGLSVYFNDATARNQAESEVRFQARLLDAVGQAVVASDLRGAIVYWNRHAEQLYGWSMDEVRGRPVAEVTLPPGEGRGGHAALLRRLRAGETVTEEREAWRRDGSRFQAFITHSPVLNAQGELIGVVSVSVDISERRATELTLRRQNALLATLHETTLAVMNRLDLTNLLETLVGRAVALLNATHGALYLLDQERGEMLPAAVSGAHLLPPGYAVRPGVDLVGLVWQSGGTRAVDDYQTWPERDPRLAGLPLYAAAAAPLRSGATVVGVIEVVLTEPGRTFTADELECLTQFAQLASVALDNARLHMAAQSELNERTRQERALRQAEARYRSIFENALEGIYQTGFDGSLQTVNQSAARILGYDTPAEMLGALANLRDLYADARLYDEFSRRLHEHGAVRDFAFPARSRDGRLLWLSTNANAIRGANGRVIGIEGMLVDITARRLAEQRLATSHAVARVLATAERLAAAAPELLAALCKHGGWDRGELYQPDPTTGALLRVACWAASEAAAAGLGCAPDPVSAPGEGPIAEAFATGVSVWQDATEATPTLAAIPICAGAEILGVVQMAGAGSRLFDPATLEVLEAAAEQIAQFCERVRQEELLQTRARQQAALAELSQRAVADSNIDALMARMVDLAADTLQADMAAVLRLLPDGATLAVRAAAGWPEETPCGQRVSAGPETQAGLTLLTNAPVVVEDMALETRFATDVERELGIVSSISVPVGGRRRPFGVLVVHCRTRRRFTGDDVFFLESAASVLAAAADRRRAEQDRQFLLAHAQEARAEAEAAQERMTNVLETTSDAFLLLDGQWRLMYLNPRAEQLFRRERRELLGRNLWEELPDLPAEMYTRLNEALATGQPVALEQFYTPTGSWLDVRAYPSATGMSVFLQDITERKRAAAALEEQARINLAQRIELEGILRQLDDGLMLADTAGRVRLLNPAARTILGLTGERAQPGAPEASYWHAVAADGRPLPPSELPLARALAGERGPARDITAIVNGEQRIISVSAAALSTEDGAPHGAVAVLRDVTEMRRAQDREMETERLRALGEMASGVAHNFNNLLAIILLRCDLLEKLDDDSPHAVAAREHIGVIKQATIDGRETVNRLQALSGVSKSKPDQAMNIAALVTDVVEFTRPRWRDAAQQHGITIEVTTDIPPLPLLQGNPADLREVLINLVFNAVDAMPRGGTIHISAEHREGSDEVILRVRDTGEGMTEAVRRRVFEPFFSTKGPKGVGLGLSMSRKLIANMGGRIGVESAPGQGATFWIALPYKPVEAQAEVAPPTLARRLAILLVDDQPHMLETAALMLEMDGHTVVTAESGRQALERIDERAAQRLGPFDVVITDLGMPEMNGLQLVAALREDGFDMPCILATGWGVELSEADTEAAGVQAVLPKPYAAAQLRAVLAQVTAHLADE